jgi:glycogen operon protein
VEGPTDDADVLELRRRQRRNFLATLLLSEGVPLLLGGDELGRTQRGNNNAYCQDNDISWVDWEHADDELATFVAELCALRREHPALRREQFFAAGEITWLRPDGAPMEAADWQNPDARAVAALVHPGLLLVNAWWEPLTFALPGDGAWSVQVDTAGTRPEPIASGAMELAGRSLVGLSRAASPAAATRTARPGRRRA